MIVPPSLLFLNNEKHYQKRKIPKQEYGTETTATAKMEKGA